MAKPEKEREVCFISHGLREKVVEKYFNLQASLEEDFVCLPGPSYEPIATRRVVNEDEFKAAHKNNHEYRRKLWYPLSAASYLISVVLDEKGISAVEAEVASQVNKTRTNDNKILGVYLDENQEFDRTKRYLYPLGSNNQISIEVAHSMGEIAPLLSKISAER